MMVIFPYSVTVQHNKMYQSEISQTAQRNVCSVLSSDPER